MRIEWLPSALPDLERLRDFLPSQNPEISSRAARTIRSAVASLEANPRLGKPVEDLPYFHDIVIPFGVNSYILRYRAQGGTIFIVALRHAKEVGLSED